MSKRARLQGELENEVLGALWDSNKVLTSNQVLDAVDADGLALTTVLTVLSRLEEKGLVKREAGSGRAFFYSAVSSREEHAAEQLLQIIQNESNQALTLSLFTAGLSKKSLTALKKLLDDK
ncbi:MAG: BlaI/MecI/CopY family transcriptional regulator [Micrococcales bacterium]